MALIVEDGTCIADANSYNSYEVTTAFLGNFITPTEYTESQINSATIQGHIYLNLVFGKRLRGTVFCPNSLFLDFPRTALYNKDNILIQGVPVNVKVAALWATLQALLGGSIQESMEASVASSVQVEGLLSVEFQDDALPSKKVDYAGLIKDRINSLMSEYIEGSTQVVQLVRMF